MNSYKLIINIVYECNRPKNIHFFFYYIVNQILCCTVHITIYRFFVENRYITLNKYIWLTSIQKHILLDIKSNK